LENLAIKLNSGHLSDITPIQSLTNLHSLSLGDTDLIQDFTPLQNLTNLEHVSLDRTGIEDLTVLSGLSNINRLMLGNTNSWASIDNLNKIREITPLATLKNLDSLNIEVNLVEDITPIASLPKLRSFVALDNQITDLVPTLLDLDFVNISRNRIADLSGLEAYGTLDGTRTHWTLNLADNQIIDISHLDPILDPSPSSRSGYRGTIDLRGNPINDEGRNLIRKWQGNWGIDIIFE